MKYVQLTTIQNKVQIEIWKYDLHCAVSFVEKIAIWSCINVFYSPTRIYAIR
jgi:hypothetical protein